VPGAPLATVPYAAAALVLGVAGLTKMVRPHDTARALRVAGLPASPAVVRVGAAVEVAVAVAAWAAPGPVPAAAVAASYLAFAGFVALALVRGWPLATCGCFGRPDTPPRSVHVVIDAVAGAAALGWLVVGRGPAGPVVGGRAALIATTAVLALLAYLVLTTPPGPARSVPGTGR
jgi:hypothetical protein